MTEEEANELFREAQAYVQYKDDEGKIQELIDKGLDVNRRDKYGVSLVERALIVSINYSALHALWKANAKPRTTYIKAIFDQFKLGATPKAYYAAAHRHLTRGNAEDITAGFSAKELKVASAFFEITKDIEDTQISEIELTLKLKPFVFEDHFTETTLQFIGLCNPKISTKVFSENGYTFSSDEMEESSIYIQNFHNPVALKKIKVIDAGKYYSIKADLLFDFEYEKTDFKNEGVTWEFQAEKIIEEEDTLLKTN